MQNETQNVSGVRGHWSHTFTRLRKAVRRKKVLVRQRQDGTGAERVYDDQ